MTAQEDVPSPAFASARSSLTVGTGSQQDDIVELTGEERSRHKSMVVDPSSTSAAVEDPGEEQRLNTTLKVSQTTSIAHLDQPTSDTSHHHPAPPVDEVAQGTRVTDAKMMEPSMNTGTTQATVPPTSPPAVQSSGASSRLTPASPSPEPPLTPTTQSRNDRRDSRRLSSLDTRNPNRFSGFISNLIHRRPDREGLSSLRQQQGKHSSTTNLLDTSRPETPQQASIPMPPPALPAPTLQELGLCLSAITPLLKPPGFNTPPASGAFLAPHYLLLCHAHGLDVVPLVSPPTPQPYALVRRVGFKSVVVMEERGVLVAIAGRRDGVRVYALEEVKKAVEWRIDVEIRREKEKQRREEAKKASHGRIDKVFSDLKPTDDHDQMLKADLPKPIEASIPIQKGKRKKSFTSTSEPPVPPRPRPRPPTIIRTRPKTTPEPQPLPLVDPPPTYSSVNQSRPRLQAQTSVISLNQGRARSGSVADVLAGTNRRRSGSRRYDEAAKSDWTEDHGSSDEEAISYATAGPSGSAALDERTSAATASNSPTTPRLISAPLDVPLAVPDNSGRVASPGNNNANSISRPNRPARLDLPRTPSSNAIPATPPSPTPTIWTLRQALSNAPAPPSESRRAVDVDIEAEDDEDTVTPMGSREPISFAEALLESRLPGLPPPGTRVPQQPILIMASHPIATDDETPSSPRPSQSDDHSISISSINSRMTSRPSVRRRWSLLGSVLSPDSTTTLNHSTIMPDPEMRERPPNLLMRSQSNHNRPSPARRPLRRPSSSPSEPAQTGILNANSSIPSVPPLPSPMSTPRLRFFPKIFINAFSVRRAVQESNSSEATTPTDKKSFQNAAQNPAPPPKLEYVKLPGTKGSLLIKAVETSKKSFLAILCGEAGEKVELFAGTYRTTLGLSRTFILPDSPKTLELQLQGDDLVEVFLVFAQNVFGLEPATVRVREVRVGRSERREARRRARENRIEEVTGSEVDAPALGDDEATAMASSSVTLPTQTTTTSVVTAAATDRTSNDPNNGARVPDPPANGVQVSTSQTISGQVPDEFSQAGPYTTFQQLAFAPLFPLATVADECVIPPTYASFLQYRGQYEPKPEGESSADLAHIQFSPPGLPLPPPAVPSRWHYRDPKGVIQGPWKASLMQTWFKDGLLPPDLPVRREEDTEFIYLQDLRLRSVDPSHPFRPTPPPLNSPILPLSNESVKPLLHPISLLTQPRRYGPPALFYSTRGGHSTAVVDARGRAVLKGRITWSPDDDISRLGDVKRLESFDIAGRAVMVAIRQGGIEVVDVGDALLKPAEHSRTVLPHYTCSSSSFSHRDNLVWKIGSPLDPVASNPVSSEPTLTQTLLAPPKKSGLGSGRSPTRLELSIAGDELEHRFYDELLFLGRHQDNIYFCEKTNGSYRILRLCPIVT